MPTSANMPSSGAALQGPHKIPDDRSAVAAAPIPWAAWRTAFLVLVSAALVGWSAIRPTNASDEPRASKPIAEGTDLRDLLNSREGIRFGLRGARYGFSLIGVPDPKNPEEEKRLTFDREGATNNTLIKINHYEFIFGSTTYNRKQVKNHPQVQVIANKYYTTKVEYLDTEVEVTQHILLVPGSSDILDNCLVYYSVLNKGKQQPFVGVRVLLDTYIGTKDGVPFTIPGRKEFLRDLADIRGKDVPNFIEAVENGDDVDDSGVVARLGLSLNGVKLPAVYEKDAGGKFVLDSKKNRIEQFPGVETFDGMTRLVICQQPDNPQVKWSWGEREGDFLPIATRLRRDSCAIMYWDDVKLNPGNTRNVGYMYGLGSLKISGGKEGSTGLALSTPAWAIQDKEFDVIAYVYNAKKGQTVTLSLPDGLKMALGENLTKAVEKNGAREPVTFKVRGTKPGKKYRIEGKTGNTKAVPVEVTVRENSIF